MKKPIYLVAILLITAAPHCAAQDSVKAGLNSLELNNPLAFAQFCNSAMLQFCNIELLTLSTI